jgi:hypothetical protein
MLRGGTSYYTNEDQSDKRARVKPLLNGRSKVFPFDSLIRAYSLGVRLKGKALN